MFFPKPVNLSIQKYHLHNYWARGKDLFLLLYIYTLSSSTVGLLLRPQDYQRCEPMILKNCVKSKFVFCQTRFYNLLTEKKDTKIYIFEVLIFLKKYCYCQSQEIFFEDHLQMVYFCNILHLIS